MKKKAFYKSLSLVLSALFVLMICSASIATADDKVLVGKTVNVNTATVDELSQVPLITKEMAEAIVNYREEYGDFQVIEELLQIDGFTREILRKIKNFLLLEGIGGDECTC